MSTSGVFDRAAANNERADRAAIAFVARLHQLTNLTMSLLWAMASCWSGTASLRGPGVSTRSDK